MPIDRTNVINPVFSAHAGTPCAKPERTLRRTGVFGRMANTLTSWRAAVSGDE